MFDGATFTGDAWFPGAKFADAWFRRATFTGDAQFDGATFKWEAQFRGATVTAPRRSSWRAS